MSNVEKGSEWDILPSKQDTELAEIKLTLSNIQNDMASLKDDIQLIRSIIISTSQKVTELQRRLDNHTSSSSRIIRFPGLGLRESNSENNNNKRKVIKGGLGLSNAFEDWI